MRKFLLLVPFLCSLAACDGADRLPLGATCDASSVCEGVCNLGLPGGMCTEPCSEADPCARGVCVFFGESSYCLPECERNEDCREGYGCVDFFCAPLQPVGARCDDSDDCQPCDGQVSCPTGSGLACMENVCAIPCDDQGDCVDGTMCAESSDEVYWCVGIDFETGPGTLGTDCSVEPCVEGLECRVFPSLTGDQSVCTHECELERECPPSMTCRLDGTGFEWCHPRQFCEACQLDSSCGYEGDLCVRTTDGAARYCSQECDPDLPGTCPIDTACTQVVRCDDGGWAADCGACAGGCDEQQVRHQCVHLQGACIGDGAACTGCHVDAQCDEGLSCLRAPGSWQTTCLPPCALPSDCPDGFICTSPGGSGTCVPRTGSCTEPSGDQGFCEVCTEQADCLRGVCAPLNGDDSGFQYCLDHPGPENQCGFFADLQSYATEFGVLTLCGPSMFVRTCQNYAECLALCPNGPTDCAEGPAHCQ